MPYKYGCDNKACEAFLDATGAPDCKDPNSEACQKAGWEWSIRTTCAAATLGAGEVLPICEIGAPILAKYTWPLVKNIMMPLGQALGDAIMALIPDAWKAHGVFSGEIMVGIWYWGHTTFDPRTDVLTGFVVPWRDAIAAVNETWRISLEMFKLDPATPLQVRSSLLRPAIPSDRLENHPESKIKHGGNVLQADGTVPEYVTDAEQALVLWLDRYYLGTRTVRGMWPEEGPVVNAMLPGSLADTERFEPRPGGGVRSRGPMGIEFQGWSEDCSGDCVKRFGQAVASCWSYRLEALRKALPEVVGAVMGSAAELADKQNHAAGNWSGLKIATPNAKASFGTRLGDEQRSARTGGGGIKWLVALGLLGVGGYGVYRWRKAKAKHK